MGKKKERAVTIRERKFIKGILEGMTPTAAMRAAGYAKTTANVKQGQKLEKVRESLQELMDRKGISDDCLLNALAEGLKATKNISCNVIIKTKDGMKDADSMTKDFVEVEDFPTRHRYLETGLKLKGHLKDTVDIPTVFTFRIESETASNGIEVED